jgi:hypothetical protein
MAGRILSIHTDVQSIPIDHLAPGHYLLRLADGSARTFAKLQ